MVAVQQGVPTSYTASIANIGVRIPGDYDEWKECILIMYKERQCNYVYNQTYGIEQRDKQHQRNQKQITTTNSKNAAGGMTSSSAGKTGGNDKSRDSNSKWVLVTTKTYGGVGEPMQIDTKKQKQRSEGRCFKCDEKGHLSRDCPHKGKQVCALEAAPTKPLSMNTKIEEVKE